MKIGYRAGYADGEDAGRKEGFEEGYASAQEDSKEAAQAAYQQGFVAGAAIAQLNVLERLKARPEGFTMAQWALAVMQEVESGLSD